MSYIMILKKKNLHKQLFNGSKKIASIHMKKPLLSLLFIVITSISYSQNVISSTTNYDIAFIEQSRFLNYNNATNTENFNKLNQLFLRVPRYTTLWTRKNININIK